MNPERSGTVNREYFDVKIFSDSIACAKIKRTKYMRNINDNTVQGRLSENYFTRKIIIAWNILDTKYLWFTVFRRFYVYKLWLGHYDCDVIKVCIMNHEGICMIEYDVIEIFC